MLATATVLGNALAHKVESKRAEALAEIDRAKAQFFANVSHEFRTPLARMLGPIESVLSTDGAELSDKNREQNRIAHRNSLRLLKLVNTLLDFSRIEAGRAQASFEPTDLAVCTKELAANFQSSIKGAGMTLTVDCASLGEEIYVDREMWEKIVLNLISNAFKFTLHGGITVTLAKLEDAVQLEVSDRNPSIRSLIRRAVRSRNHALSSEKRV